VDKPLGLTLADKKGSEGGVVVASVSGGGNAAKAGLKVGDTVLYTSSFFGDELWPADKAAFTRTAINAKQNDVDFVILRGNFLRAAPAASLLRLLAWVPAAALSRSACAGVTGCKGRTCRDDGDARAFLTLVPCCVATHAGKAADEINVKRLKARPSPPRFGRKLTEAQKARATHICLDCGFIYFQAASFDELQGSYECPQCAAPKNRFAKYDPVTGKTSGSAGAPQIVNIVGAIGLVGIIALVVVGLQ
jgi:hypothetical protein